MMETTEPEFTEDFRKILIEHKGYPPESLILDYRITPQSRADILIVERHKLLPLGLIELKRRAKKSYEDASLQIDKYLDDIRRDLPAYLISFTDDGGFRTLRFDHETKLLEPIDFFAEFPDYDSLVIGQATAELHEKEQTKKRTVDHFKVICYTLALILILLFILKKADVITFTSEDMMFLGAIVALFIIPNAAQLKMLGVEYRAKNEEKGN